MRKVLDELREHRHSAALSSHQPAQQAESAVVLSPMDLNAVRSAVDSGAFKTTAEFLRSVALMFLNVTMSNSSNTEVQYECWKNSGNVLVQSKKNPK